jgi:hypothetical protein
MEIKNSVDLKAAILELEDRKDREKKQLVKNLNDLTESLKPINLIKSTIQKVKEGPGVGPTLVKATMGVGVTMLSKKFLFGKSPGIFRKIIGSAIQMGLAGLVAKKTPTLNNSGKSLLSKIFRSKNSNFRR